ncbi:MAG: hypothetical protein ACNFW9_04455 [Candidatus Kerfeldbacteria bacterium]|jgi:hypothetical protein
MNLNFVYLSLMFLGAGILSVFYYKIIPDKKTLRDRLPNKATVESVVLFLAISIMVWQIIINFDGLQRASRLMALVLGLLLFETFFFLFMYWIKKNWLNVLLSILLVIGIFSLHYSIESFVTFNLIIILATIGGTAYLVRSGIIKTWLVFLLTAIWMPYDVYFVTQVFDKYTKVTASPFPFFAFPSVTVGDISLGVGDFIFLALYTFILVSNFNKKIAIIHAIVQAIGLLIAGYLVSVQDITIPFLVVLSPIFFIIYFTAYLINKKSNKNQ